MNVYDSFAALCSGATIGSIFLILLTDDGTDLRALASAMMYASVFGTLLFNREARKMRDEEK